MESSRGTRLPNRLRVGGWLVERDACSLSRGAEQVHVRPLLIDLLLLLAEHRGEILSKDLLLERLWGGRFVSESLLTRTMAELRQILGHTVGNPRVIETVAKRGYRLVAPVEECHGERFPRVAVLIFANLNRDPDLDYFAEGMTDALITELGTISSLRVISRQSVLRMQHSSKSLPEIAGELNVDAVVEGATLRSGEQVRITAQLVQANPERHLWAQSYDCELKDVLEVQGQLARRIAESVEAALTPAEIGRFERPRQIDPKAHVAYLKARYHIARWSQEAIRKGFEHLHEAIASDPTYAPAYVELAIGLAALGYWGYMPLVVAYPRAKEAALRALQLDESSGRGHAAAGFITWLLDWDLAGCERHMRRGLELSPSDDFVHLAYSKFLLVIARRRDEAIAEGRVALELDPLSLNTNFSFGWQLMFAGDYDKAVEQARVTLEMFPDSLQGWWVLGWSELGRGRLPDAVSAFDRALALSRDDTSLAYSGYANGLAGNEAVARAVLNELEGRQAAGFVANFPLALVYAGLDERDQLFTLLERCFQERDSKLFWLPLLPRFDRFDDDARYQTLVGRLGLPISGGVWRRTAATPAAPSPNLENRP